MLFCGTPCQVASLDPILVRIILPFVFWIYLPGVPSPLAWKKYLDYQKLITGADIKSVSFRDKKTGWKIIPYPLGLKIIWNRQNSFGGLLFALFFMDLDLRKSSINADSEIFIAFRILLWDDFWGVDNLGIDWADDKGVSLVLIHSEKGGKLFEACESRFQTARVEFNDAVKSNPAMLRSTPQRRSGILFKGCSKIAF